MRLTAKERILLHLLAYVTFRDAVEVPPELAQDGLAEAAGVELRHVTQYVRPLVREELVAERTAHVKGGRQRRKVYVLTDKGQMAAYSLRERVKAAPVRVRDAGGVRETTAAAVLEALGPAVSLPRLLRQAEAGPLDLAALSATPAEVHVEMLAEAPRLDRFVGRRTELDAITAEGDGPRIFVVRGVAGIGKSSVAAKACEVLSGRRNLFWHTLRPWDTRASVMAALGEFLAALGKPGLKSVAAQGETGRMAEMLRDDLPGTHAFLVLDDAHEAAPELLDLFRFLKDVLADAKDSSALFLTRRSLPFYDRRDVALRHLVREIDLAGLTAEDIASFLSPAPDAALAHLAQRTGGHPLLLQLVRSSAHPVEREDALRDLHRFLEEEVYGDLTDAERTALKTAALYRVPVPRDALHADPAVSHDVLLALTNRSLLRAVGSDALEAHEAIRSYFAGILTPSEREALAPFAAHQLRALAAKAREEGNGVACIGFIANALDLTEDGEERVGLEEVLGDVNEKVGDFPSALTAWKEAAKAAQGSEVRARLHRKMASAFEARGDMAATRTEIEVAWRALDSAISVERGWIDLVESRAAAEQEEWDRAREAAQHAVEAFERFGDREGLVRSLHQLGYVAMEAPGDDTRAVEPLFERALAIARELEDPELIVRMHTSLAHLYGGELGEEAKALEHIAAAEAVPGGLSDPQTRRSFLTLQGWFHLDIRADCPTAARYFSEAADLARKIHFASSVVFAQYGLALAAYYGGDVEEARARFRDYARDILALGFPGAAVEALCLVAECDLRLGDLEDFGALARECGKPAYAEGKRARPVQAKLLEAGQAVVRGDEAQAEAIFRDALRLASEGTAGEEALFLHLVHFYHGVCLRAWGRREEGDAELKLARELLEERRMRGRLGILPEAERELTETLVRVTAR